MSIRVEEQGLNMDLMQFVVVPGYLPNLVFDAVRVTGLPSIQFFQWQDMWVLLFPVLMVMWMADELGRSRAYLLAALLASPLFTALLLLAMGPSLGKRMERRLDEELEVLKRDNERGLRDLVRLSKANHSAPRDQ